MNRKPNSEIIDRCAADFDIRYALLSDGDEIYVGYYDESHNLKIAKRNKSGIWQYAKLPEHVSHDSHCYITMAMDRDGYIHLSGNMHCDPLVYYRSERPRDITSFKKTGMTGDKEQSVTYPEFMTNGDDLIFHYRDGESGNGNTYLNFYDSVKKNWRKISSSPLFDGKEISNSYFKGPVVGPDGRYHLIWCWRDTKDCITNHGLYYAGSDDLKEWKSLSGFYKKSPITPEDSGFLIDDIPCESGLINGGFALGFEKENGMPVVAYHKYDENGNTNIYSAISGKDGWELRRLTDWKWRWNFSGKGSVPFLLDIQSTGMEKGVQFVRFARQVRPHFLSTKRMMNFRLEYNPSGDFMSEMPVKEDNQRLIRPSSGRMLVHIERDRLKETDSPYMLRYETIYPARDKNTGKKIPPQPLVLIGI